MQIIQKIRDRASIITEELEDQGSRLARLKRPKQGLKPKPKPKMRAGKKLQDREKEEKDADGKNPAPSRKTPKMLFDTSESQRH